MADQKSFSIIMAAGKGNRMNCPGQNKVYLEIDGLPAVIRALDTYESCGLGHHIIVVGECADQVMSVVGERFPNCTFAYQPVPLGTGNAIKVGARVLQDAGYTGPVFVTAGDKYIEADVVRDLIARFEQGQHDLMLVAGRKNDYPTSGRVLTDDQGAPTAIVEVSEIRLSRALQEIEPLLAGQNVKPQPLLEIIQRHFTNEKKAKVAFGELWHLLQPNGEGPGHPGLPTAKVRPLVDSLRHTVTLPLWRGGEMTPIPASEVEDMTDLANISVYMYSAPALYHSLAKLARDNAQHEEFLTDTIKILASERNDDGTPTYRLGTVVVDDPELVMGYNTPEELDTIRQVVTRKAAAKVQEDLRELRPVSQWHHFFADDGADMHRFMDEIYGPDRDLHARKRQEYLHALELYRSRLGTDDEVMLIRTPGRINLMGRHTDHRGSRTNMIAISQEVLMVVAPRDDDRFRLYNSSPEAFQEASFSIGDEISRLDWGDWLETVRSPRTIAMVSDGHWANYVKAPAFRLQKEFPDQALRGADIVIHGTIPVGSGLSSSSAMVVGAAEALIAINSLPVRPAAMVDLCGEGEWFVGTRGGSSDHAAIKFARRGQVAHVSFFPFAVQGFAPFFEDHSLIVCNSGIQAKKAQGARQTYNSKVLGYVIGELLFRRFNPQFADRIEHLRDLNCENLGIGLADLYGLLRKLPLRMTEQELDGQYGPFDPADEDKLRSIFSGLSDRSAAFDVRPLVIYGLAECERSKLCFDVLQRGDAEALGQLWNLSHDGDRVVSHDTNWRQTPFAGDCSDEYLDRLVADLESSDPARQEAAQLYRQVGCYACSTPEIDLIVDTALRTPGVKGAQISGAGLGGCVMILAENSSRDAAVRTFRTRSLDTEIQAPVAGSGLVRA
ncbi:MAG: NTP transferase domain-containing protein [Armatimonadia bacterium]